METEIQTHSDSDKIIKKAEFQTFRLWRNIPTGLKIPPPSKTGERPTVRQWALSMGIEDETIIALAEITTQKQFSERYNVDEDTLTAWNKVFARMPEDNDLRYWAKMLTKNILFSMYAHATRKGNPLLMKQWLEYVQKFNPTVKVDTTYRGVATMTVVKDNERIPAPHN